MTNERINILIASDINYAPYYGVMLTSLFLNNKESAFDIYLITDNTWTKQETAKFERLCSKYNSNFYVRVVKDEEIIDTFPLAAHLNRATYFNLNVANLLPKSVHRVIYMDGDMVVNGDIRPLWNLNLKDKVCAMALAPMWNDDYEYQRLGYDKKYGYYNNGTTLYDLDFLRDYNFFNKAIDYINQNREHLDMLDQDVTNALLHEKIYQLPLVYNLQVKLLWKTHWETYNEKFRTDLLNEANHPIIVHFSASSKPWHFSYYGKPYAKLWNKYYRLSDWHGIKCKKPLYKYIKNLLKRILKPHSFATQYIPEIKHIK